MLGCVPVDAGVTRAAMVVVVFALFLSNNSCTLFAMRLISVASNFLHTVGLCSTGKIEARIEIVRNFLI